MMRISMWPDMEVKSNPLLNKLCTEFAKTHSVSIIPLSEHTQQSVDIIWLNWFENFWLLSKENPGRADKDPRKNIWNNIKKMRHSGAKVVYTMHNVTPHDWKHSSCHWFQWAEDFYRNIDAVIHFSSESKRILDTYFPINSLVTSHPGDDLGYYINVLQGLFMQTVSIDECLVLGDIVPRKNIPGILEACVSSSIDKVVVRGRAKNKDLLAIIQEIAANSRQTKISIETQRVSDSDLRSSCGANSICILNQPHALNSGIMLFAVSNGSTVLAPKTTHNIELRDSIGSSWIRLYESPLSGKIIDSIIETPCSNAEPQVRLHADVASEIFHFFSEIAATH